jgi:hypothetical protein
MVPSLIGTTISQAVHVSVRCKDRCTVAPAPSDDATPIWATDVARARDGVDCAVESELDSDASRDTGAQVIVDESRR